MGPILPRSFIFLTLISAASTFTPPSALSPSLRCSGLASTPLRRSCPLRLAPHGSGKRIPALRQPRALGGSGMRMEGEGYTGDYTWGQTDQDILIVIPVGEELRGKEVKYDLQTTRLSLSLPEGKVFELEELFRPVVADDSFWEIDEENGSKILRIQLSKAAQGVEWTHLLTRDDTPPDVTVTDLCFFDVGVDGESIGQVTFGLYGNAAPKTAANFMALCTGEVTTPDGKPLHYLDSPFHRIIPGFMCQGGDFTTGDGTGGMSIFGEWFADEAFLVKHDRALLLSMANFEVKDSNGSQFLITCGPAPHLDGRHVVFGEVLDGGGVVKQMEMLGTASGATLKDVRILACGAL